MAKIERKTQKIFCADAETTELAVFGTMKNIVNNEQPVYSNDVETLQSNAAFLLGFQSAVVSGFAPFLEELNGVLYVITTQLAYLLTNGIPEYDENTTYFIGDMVKIIDNNIPIIKYSVIDNNIGNSTSDTNYWADSSFGGGTARNIGEIVTSTIPLTDAGLHLLDGSLINGGGIYSSFVNYIANLYNNNLLYAYVYNDGTDDYKIYTKTTTLDEDTVLYTSDSTQYTGSDFEIVEVSGDYEIQYDSNTCTYTSTDNVQLLNCFTDETSWQSSVTTYGVCGKFVYNSTNSTVRLPKITGFTEGTVTESEQGSLTEAGLPNITGSLQFWSSAYEPTGEGAFGSKTSSASAAANAGDTMRFYTQSFDASLSNSVYGNSETVQPQAVKVLYYIVVATSTKTEAEVDIDEIATDLNGKADVDLNNVASSKGILTESYSSGTSWYRLYSDGWCVQGSVVSVTQTAAGQYVSLLKSYNNTSYTLLVSLNSLAATWSSEANPRAVQYTDKIHIQSGGSTEPSAMSWIAYGYIS